MLSSLPAALSARCGAASVTRIQDCRFPLEITLSRIALVLSLCAVPAAALAQPATSCATFAKENAIPAPPDSLTDQAALLAITQTMLPINFDLDLIDDLPGAEAMRQPDINPRQGCSLREMAMLTANFAAIDKAEIPADPAAFAGTWMSDDMFLGTAGLMVPGQEVLVIGEPVPASEAAATPELGPAAGSLPVSQYWYHGFTPYTHPVWNAQDEYYGLIASGHLTPRDKGGYADDPIQALIDYAGITIIPERTEDLFLKSRLNVFQRDVVFALAQDTLVLTYDAPVPIHRVWTERKRTYHRVAPGSPDAALRILQAANLPAMPYFNCLTQKISDADPALLAVIAPMTLAELDAELREYSQMERDKNAYMALVQTGGEDAALKQKFIGEMERMLDISDKAQNLGQALQAAQLCARPPYFGLL